MPVFGCLGKYPRRSDAAIVRREQRFCERKGKTSLKGKGRQGSGGKSSWGEARGGKGKGKPRVAMEAWANRDATADAPSTVVETWSGWGLWPRGRATPRTRPGRPTRRARTMRIGGGTGGARNQWHRRPAWRPAPTASPGDRGSDGRPAAPFQVQPLLWALANFNHGSGSYALDSHGRGARGAAVRLDSCRLVVAQVARTGKRIRLPMPNPAHHPSPPAAPTTPLLPSSIQLLRALPIPCYHPS